jgi:transcription elongation factor GreA
VGVGEGARPGAEANARVAPWRVEGAARLENQERNRMQLMTQQERDKLAQQLKELVARRPVIAQSIADAREKGDLKENADYHAARDELAMLEARIKDFDERLRSVSVVNADEVPAGMVFLGSTVKVKNTKTGSLEMFKLVGEVGKLDDDSDVLEVSSNSPLGEALMRAQVGTTVRVAAPRGEIHYEIVEIV